MIRPHQSRTSLVSGEGPGQTVCRSTRRPIWPLQVGSEARNMRFGQSNQMPGGMRLITSNHTRFMGSLLTGSQQHWLKSGDISKVYNWPESLRLYNRKCPGTYKGRIDGEVNPSILRGRFLPRVEIAAKAEPHTVAFPSNFVIFSLLLSSLELSDTKVCEP